MIISLIIVGASISVFIGILGSNATQMRVSRLNHELRTVMNQITRDVRRAGFQNWTGAQLEAGNLINNGHPDPVVSADSIAVSYDIEGTGSSTERYAYRLFNGAIETSINNGTWTALTDRSAVNVTNFTITDLSPAKVLPADSEVQVGIPVFLIEIAANIPAQPNVSRALVETVRLRNVLLEDAP